MTIIRERHPFEGRALPVIGSIHRNGVLFALACLPDGSRALIPAQWTDWDEGQRNVAAGTRLDIEVSDNAHDPDAQHVRLESVELDVD